MVQDVADPRLRRPVARPRWQTPMSESPRPRPGRIIMVS